MSRTFELYAMCRSSPVELTDPREFGISTLGTLKEHPRIRRFRDFLKGWYLSYFYPDAARSLPTAGPQRHLNVHGDNIGNVVQFMEREHKDRFKGILDRIASKIPGIAKIDMTIPDKPQSSKQRYRLTDLGKMLRDEANE